MNIFDIITEKVPDKKIRALKMAVGDISGVSVEALRFSFDIAKKGTALEDAELKIKRVKVSVRCRKCGAGAVLKDRFVLQCPECPSRDVEIVKGRELNIEYVEVND